LLNFSAKNILKIITSVPGAHQSPKTLLRSQKFESLNSLAVLTCKNTSGQKGIQTFVSKLKQLRFEKKGHLKLEGEWKDEKSTGWRKLATFFSSSTRTAGAKQTG
jgi:hypothetical protein